MTKSLAICLTTVLASGCMSHEQAANDKYNEVMQDLAGQQGAKADLFGVGERVGNWALCKVLRQSLGDNPDAQKLMLIGGGFGNIAGGAAVVGASGELGWERVYDLANYQEMAAWTWGVGAHAGSTGVAAQVGGYRGFMWGHHSSVLDTLGFRGSVDLMWGPPLINAVFAFDAGVRALGGGSLDKPLAGAALFGKAGIGPDLGLGRATSLGFAAEVKAGSVIAANDRTAKLAEKNAQFGARLNTRCPKAHFVQFDGLDDDPTEGYHTRRGKAVAAAILRDHAVLGLWTGPIASAMAKVAAGLGVARDHGGFSELCGGPATPSLDESPVPEPRCPTLPDVNPELEPDDPAGATDPTSATSNPGDPTDSAPAPSTTAGSCHKYELFDLRYCTADCPCKEGEGDCDTDAQCEGDLVCVRDVGADYGASESTDICGREAGATGPIDPEPTEPTDPASTDPASTDPASTDPVNQGPTAVVSFVSPEQGSIVNGQVEVELQVADGQPLQSISLLVDDALEHQWFAPPYLTSAMLAPGTHTLKAVVKHVDGQLSDVGPVVIDVRSPSAAQPGQGDSYGAPPPYGDPSGAGYGNDQRPAVESAGCSLAGEPAASGGAAWLLGLALLSLLRRRRG